ncbi:tRNA nucleotidyltransferase [Pediococcus damnosus]|uniref:CCA tRNA nucleotidyltransferase n=1 Tax=Pediococcus damnosus TaxID=51663 RepID=UPI00078E4FC6|nr:CCA tRNA nucleotidyltransferase [Pediococcus damnosus]AMV61549.1 tRNA nucleotidyltransferase [Pediococcus damnosus]AMV65912.1 tRNA nucleotidyltransferase [Pediococcus damnosus]
MQIKKLPQEFITARPILQTIEGAGYEAYFVGGSVRDTILKDHIHDVDIATSAFPSEVKDLFKKTIDTGIKHGTVMVLDHQQKYEVTTFRTESGYQDFRRPDKVTFVRSLEEDLKRRDFTVNALALKEDGTVVDLFSGLQDLQNHILKAVGIPEERFHEDALRMMRAVRFASKLDFVIEEKTEAAIKHNAPLLKKIAVERILVEFEKMMMGQATTKGVKYFLEIGLYAYCPQFEGKLKPLSQLLNLNPKFRLTTETQVWLLICHTLELSREQSRSFLRAWKTSNELIAEVESGIQLLNAISKNSVSEKLLFRTGKKVLQSVINVLLAMNSKIDTSTLLARYNELPIKSTHELNVNGHDLLTANITTPGPQMGRIISYLLDGVLTGQFKNNQSELLLKAKKYTSSNLES